jgi:thioredoxin 1
VDAVASQLGEKVKVVKVDVDAEPDLAGRYNIQSIPALYIFKGGRVVDQILGAVRAR